MLVLMFIFYQSNLFSQNQFSLSGRTIKNISTTSSNTIERGSSIKLIGMGVITNRATHERTPYYSLSVNSMTYAIEIKNIDKIEFDRPNTSSDAWAILAIKSGTYENLLNNGYQYDLRNQMDEENVDFIDLINKQDGFFYDPYLQDYLQRILIKIHPITLLDERPGNLNIQILKSDSPNSFCSTNGTIFITTSLLSVINSEDELYGVIAHEIAHFVFDHQIINLNKQINRAERAAFWSAFATVLAGATEAYLATEHEIYTGGALTLATAMSSVEISSAITERLGVKYSQDQELEADRAVIEVMKCLKRDTLAFSSALTKLRNYNLSVGNYYALSGSGTHPNLDYRISLLGYANPEKYSSPKYQKLISIVTTYNAILEYNNFHLLACNQLVDKNIEAGVATEDDYILKGIVLRILYDSDETNLSALQYIQKAKKLNVTPTIEVHKQEGITLLRLNKNIEAIEAFKTYKSLLDQEYSKQEKNFKNTDYLKQEIDWTNTMIYKVSSI